MLRDDEEDSPSSLSSGRAWERRDLPHVDPEKQEQKRKQREHKRDLTKLRQQVLRKSIDPAHAKKSDVPVTKSRDQERQSRLAKADMQPETDAMLREEEQVDALKKVTEYEQQGDGE